MVRCGEVGRETVGIEFSNQCCTDYAYTVSRKIIYRNLEKLPRGECVISYILHLVCRARIGIFHRHTERTNSKQTRHRNQQRDKSIFNGGGGSFVFEEAF